MKLKTHGITPIHQMNKSEKIVFIISLIIIFLLFYIIAIGCLIEKSIAAGIVSFLAPIFLSGVFFVMMSDMQRAYVEINGDEIKVVDYYCFIKKEKNFTFSDIHIGKDSFGLLNICIPGYVYPYEHTYLIFRNKNKKYLFKIRNCEASKKAFEKFINKKA